MSKEENPDGRKKAKRSLVPKDIFINLLAQENKLPIATASTAAAELQNLTQNRGDLTYSQVFDEIQAHMYPTTKAERERIINERLQLTQVIDNLQSGILDPLESYRESVGLAAEREKLLFELKSQLSFERGLEIFNIKAEKHLGKKFENVNEINKIYPDMTKETILMFSLITEVPDIFFNELPLNSNSPHDKNKTNYLIPAILGATPSGLLIGDETIDPNLIYQDDVLGNLGITDTDGSIIITDFTPEVKKLINKLIPLMITCQRLHEQVWNYSDTSIVDGIAKLNRFALSQLLKDLPEDKSNTNILNSMRYEEKIQYSKKRDELYKKFSKNIIVDPYSNTLLLPDKLLHLIGILDHIPASLLQDEPFSGIFIPYGTGISFINNQGQIIENTAYHPFYIRRALQGIYNEQSNSKPENITIGNIFNQLANAAQGMIMDEALQTGQEPSILEGIKLDAKLKWNIDFELSSRMYYSKKTHLDNLSYSKSNNIFMIPNYPFGVKELMQVEQTLKLLPIEFLKAIKSIQKLTEFKPIDEIINNVHEAARINLHTGKITLLQSPLTPYSSYSPELIASRSFSIVHEVAHTVWEQMSNIEKASWKNISWSENKNTRNIDKHFLTTYSFSQNEIEDFCEHFAAYVLHGDEFREKTLSAQPLKEKYELIKNIFKETTGNFIEYPNQFPWSIEELLGRVEQIAKKLSSAEIGKLLEQREEYEEDVRTYNKNISNLIVRIDEETVEDIIDSQLLEDLDIKPISNTESSLQDYIIKQKVWENIIGQIREEIIDLRDIFISCNSLSEKTATDLAKKIYILIKQGNKPKAIQLVKSTFKDEEEWMYLYMDDFTEMIREL